MAQSTHARLSGPGVTTPIARLWLWVRALPAALLAEQRQWVLWFPVMVGGGVGIYFALPTEPPAWMGGGFALAAALAALLVGLRWRLLGWLVLILAVGPAMGFAAAQQRTQALAAPMLRTAIGPTDVVGRVVAIDRLETGTRMVLALESVTGLTPQQMPARARLRLPANRPPPPVGERVRVWAVLSPTAGPVEPGSFDFRRHSYFLGIGAAGYVRGGPDRLGRGGPPSAADRMERVREIIADRVGARLNGGAAGIATALLNGEPSAIPESDLVAMRQSGLQHLISISGLHVGLIAGLVFLLVRGGLALIPPVALRHPIKKYAALAGMVAAITYMFLVGAPVPTQRAALMTCIILLAVLVDRNPFSLRVIALAALVVLLIQPDSLTGPSFQMSFAAVTALILVYEALARRRAAHPPPDRSPLRRMLTYIGGLALTSLVAGLATTPYALYHFQQMANYGLLANMIAVPVTGFWVMPCGLAVYLLLPLGWEGPAVMAMGWGVDLILWTAHAVADLPGAAARLPALPLWTLVAFTLGALWLGLWRQPWRWLGVAGPLVFLLALLLTPRPDLFIAADGDVVAVRARDGGLLVSSRRAGRFDSDQWAARDGSGLTPRAWGKAGQPADGIDCADGVCLYSAKGRRVLLSWHSTTPCPPALDVVITLKQGRADCPAPLHIGEEMLRAHGAHSLYLAEEGIRVDRAIAVAEGRPWQ